MLIASSKGAVAGQGSKPLRFGHCHRLHTTALGMEAIVGPVP